MQNNTISLNKVKQMEVENKQLQSRIKELENKLEQWDGMHTKQDTMLRKQLFRLDKERSHLVAKLTVMEETSKEQNEVLRDLIRIALNWRESKRVNRGVQNTVCSKQDVKNNEASQSKPVLNFRPIND